MINSEMKLASDELKLRTRDLHTRIESKLNISNRICSLESYTPLLHGLYALYSAFENALSHFPWAQAGIDFPQRQKAKLLQKDLTQVEGAASSPFQPVPVVKIADMDQAFGVLYVLEGATLGGKYIAREAAAAGVIPAEMMHFYSGYGEDTGRMWTSFKDALNKHCTTESQIESAVTGATLTFQAFETFLPDPTI